MDNLQLLKSSYDLRSLARRIIPGREEKHTSYSVYRCPKHSDSSPSLTVYDHSFYCYSCNRGGSVFDFLIEYQGLSLSEAIMRIKNENPEVRPVEKQPEPVKPSISMALVEENAAHIEEGLHYFHQRGISDPISYQVPLGVRQEYKSYYQTRDGRWIQLVAKRYAVPNIFEGKVRAINYRRDDQAFLDSFYRHPQHELILADLKERIGEISEKDILNNVSGKKYKQEEGSQWKPFNVGLIAKREEGKVVYIPQPYLLLHAEPKEFDTLGLMSAGYPSVGVYLAAELETVLPRLFSHIPIIYIIKDNDDAGLKKAVRLQNILDRGRIISPIVGKDTGDVIQEGLIDKWMSKYGLEAVLK